MKAFIVLTALATLATALPSALTIAAQSTKRLTEQWYFWPTSGQSQNMCGDTTGPFANSTSQQPDQTHCQGLADSLDGGYGNDDGYWNITLSSEAQPDTGSYYLISSFKTCAFLVRPAGALPMSVFIGNTDIRDLTESVLNIGSASGQMGCSDSAETVNNDVQVQWLVAYNG